MFSRHSNVVDYTHTDTPSEKREHFLAQQPDHALNQWIAGLTGGLDPIAFALALGDWAMHLGLSAGKQQTLLNMVTQSWADAARQAHEAAEDDRLKADSWSHWPFSFYRDSYLMARRFWHCATTDVQGTEQHHLDMVSFAARQWLEAISPANFAATNPQVITKTLESKGMNLIQGLLNAQNDGVRYWLGDTSSEQFKPGEQVAVTPGNVVLRNDLIELIQYAPQTDSVYKEPILIVPAWIMKYYILDLSPHNSLVQYLLSQGHTVFMISWKNPQQRDHDKSFEDYMKLGVDAAVTEMSSRFANTPINAVGYCLGGTLLSATAAWYARENRKVFNTVTLFAAQVDFEQAGELRLFIDDSQLAMLDAVMQQKGYLDKSNMAGTFTLLRANYLLWSRWVNEYLLGEQQRNNDLLAWNKDATRMPARMHSEYLHQCYLHNALARNAMVVDNRPIALSDISTDWFVVGTTKDHVAPWRSVYNIHNYAKGDITFLLTNGGHNAGIISEPGHPHRFYQVHTHKKEDTYLSPQAWLDKVPLNEGSWWPVWEQWLVQHNSEQRVAAPASPICSLDAAPGEYVLMP